MNLEKWRIRTDQAEFGGQFQHSAFKNKSLKWIKIFKKFEFRKKIGGFVRIVQNLADWADQGRGCQCLGSKPILNKQYIAIEINKYIDQHVIIYAFSLVIKYICK